MAAAVEFGVPDDVVYLGLLDADFTVREPPELAGRLRVLAARYQRASAV